MSFRGVWVVRQAQEGQPGPRAGVGFSRRFPTVERRARQVHAGAYAKLPDDAAVEAFVAREFGSAVA